VLVREIMTMHHSDVCDLARLLIETDYYLMAPKNLASQVVETNQSTGETKTK
jgi:hypothetical protein